MLIVGSKADYKPFGFRDPLGAIVGFEPDIAKYVADKLGVKLEIEPVVSSNRMQFLQQGKIDLMIATMNDKPDRRQIVGIIEPLYYASGVNLLANKKAGIKTWEQLKGQKVCGIQGAWYNKPVAEQYGADFVAFKGQTEAEVALQQGNCIGWVYDDTAFAERLADPKWAGFEMTLPSIMEEPWGLAVALPEREGAWGKFMAATVEEMHRNGKMIELEKKWNIPASAYLKKMNEQYAGRRARELPSFPSPRMRGGEVAKLRLVTFDLSPVGDWFRVLHATSGIQATIFYDAFDRARFFNGFLTSVRLMGLLPRRRACSSA